jgi:hypothetical protein
MNINELKKLIQQEQKRLSEATEPGTPKAKMDAAKKAKEVDPNAPTVLKKDFTKDPSVPPPESKQPKSKYEMQSPEDFYRGIIRLHNALRDKFDLQMDDQDAYELIREITSQEIEKIRQQYPELNLGHKLS